MKTLDNGEEQVQSWPLRAHGSLTDLETRHLLLQFSAVAAHKSALIFVLAKQKQRHAVLRSVAARVKHASFNRFMDLVTGDGFMERLQHAIDEPTSDAASKLQGELLPLLALTGKDVPFSRLERGGVVRQMLGMAERQAEPSLFWTLSLDDAHQTISVRLSFPSKSNTSFPAFAGDVGRVDPITGKPTNTEVPGWQKMLEALQRGGSYDEGDVVFNEGTFQRLAAENPVATSFTYQLVVDAVLDVLLGLPDERHRRKTDALLDCVGGDEDRERKKGERRLGMCGLTSAQTHVTETSGREALHIHGAAWTSLAPKLLARLASDEGWMKQLVEAIDTQVRAYVDWEVHVVHQARVVLGVKAPRASFATPPKHFTAATRGPIALSALTLGDHANHSHTCHKGPGGCKGCRGGYRRGHYVDATGIVQLVHRNALRDDFDQFAGNHGKPACCSCCRLHWHGEPGADAGHCSLSP